MKGGGGGEGKGLFPDYDEILTDFEKMINWKRDSSGKKIPEPVLGLDPYFDGCNEKVDELKK